MLITYVKKAIESIINTYTKGLYSVSDCIIAIDHIIQDKTAKIESLDKRIAEQNNLYIFAFKQLEKAIQRMNKQ